MEANAPHAISPRFQVAATDKSHFAWLGTRLALERTLMAWVRTGIGLVGFGFTIVQFFERFGRMDGVASARYPFAARYVGLVLIGAGIVALVLSAAQYRKALRYLWQRDFAALAGADKAPGSTPVYALAIGLVLLSVFAFLAVLVRAV
jgi:putative membrane protein